MDKIGVILDEINQEARCGMVDCGLKHWLYYSNYEIVNGRSIFNDVKKKYNVVVPCLKIGDKEKLVDSIRDYLMEAESFYGELDYDRVTNVHKYTIATALSNLGVNDFNNLDVFFKRRLAFLQDDTLSHFKKAREIGYSQVFDANVEVELRQESIFMETPYSLYISIIKYNDAGRKLSYPLPVVRFGINHDEAYFYAIQKDQSEDLPEDKEYVSFCKKIRRKMYGVGAGLTEEERSIDTIDNIHEVSPWALIALSITLGLLKKFGVDRVTAYPLMLNRYNANVIYSQEELERLKDNQDEIYKEFKEHLVFLRENIDTIQENISDKFIRTFRRIAYHFSGIDVDDVSLSDDFSLKMKVNHGYNCNNPLLEEMFNLGMCYNYGEVKKLI